MIPSWFAIGSITFALAVALNRLSPRDIRWFKRLRRPPWLTFEGAIPLIWTVIFLCGAASATALWEADPGSRRTWSLMAVYLLLEVAILAYTPVTCKLRSLRVGTAIGAVGWAIGMGLAWLVLPISGWAVGLLLPYLLWAPVGTYVTWEMARLNPGN